MHEDNQPMTEVLKGSPVFVAWEAYKVTPEYENTKKWAGDERHVEGSLWAAFIAGFGAHQKIVADKEAEESAYRQRVYETAKERGADI